jgi:hypothetical protein
MWVDGDACTQLAVHLPHHKTATTSTHGSPITFSLPPVLNQLALLYLHRALPVLSRAAAQPVQHVFFNAAGRGISNYPTWWKGIVLAGTGWDDITPQLARHMYVCEVMERHERGLPAPAPADAAVVMGNSEQAWQRSYWLTQPSIKSRRASKAAVQTEAMFAGVAVADASAARGGSEQPAAPSKPRTLRQHPPQQPRCPQPCPQPRVTSPATQHVQHGELDPNSISNAWVESLLACIKQG